MSEYKLTVIYAFDKKKELKDFVKHSIRPNLSKPAYKEGDMIYKSDLYEERLKDIRNYSEAEECMMELDYWIDQMEDESLSKKKRNNAEHIASSFDNQFHCKYSDYLQKALESGKEISDIAEETLKEGD